MSDLSAQANLVSVTPAVSDSTVVAATSKHTELPAEYDADGWRVTPPETIPDRAQRHLRTGRLGVLLGLMGAVLLLSWGVAGARSALEADDTTSLKLQTFWPMPVWWVTAGVVSVGVLAVEVMVWCWPATTAARAAAWAVLFSGWLVCGVLIFVSARATRSVLSSTAAREAHVRRELAGIANQTRATTALLAAWADHHGALSVSGPDPDRIPRAGDRLHELTEPATGALLRDRLDELQQQRQNFNRPLADIAHVRSQAWLLGGACLVAIMAEMSLLMTAAGVTSWSAKFGEPPPGI